MESKVIVEGVGKVYGAVQALQDINFSVGEGEIFGIIGPDGAGKTSLFRILTTLLLPDSGTAIVDGFDVVKDYKFIRHCVGYMPGRFSLYQDLTVEENLRFFAAIFNTTIAKNYHLIKDIYVQIEPFKNRRAGKLSGGMKQKLALCCALIHEPTVLFLDEPTTGVDPVSRREFWEMLGRLKEHGITILVSTAYMDEASQCDRIALIQTGKILTIKTPHDLVNAYGRTLWGIKTEDQYQSLNDLRNFDFTERCHTFGDTLHLTLNSEAIGQKEIEAYLIKNKHTQIDIQRIAPGIEDSFMQLMAKETTV